VVSAKALQNRNAGITTHFIYSKTSPTLTCKFDPTFPISLHYLNLKMVSFCLNQLHKMSARIVKETLLAPQLKNLERTPSLLSLPFLVTLPDLVDGSSGEFRYLLCYSLQAVANFHSIAVFTSSNRSRQHAFGQLNGSSFFTKASWWTCNRNPKKSCGRSKREKGKYSA
jgi:hypothetical protein